MVGSIRDFLRFALFLPVLWHIGCSCYPGGEIPDASTASSSSSSSSSGGNDEGPCGVDCSKYETPPCTVAVCNDAGQYVGPINTCVVIPATKGDPCDDGKFCTVGESCLEGACVGGTQNNCGVTPSPCSSVVCYEDAKTCDITPVNDGTECTPSDLCQVNGVCTIGECVGEPKDCSFSPLNECNDVGCDSATGKCMAVPDPNKDDAACVLTGDPCNTNKTCKTGLCQGGKPKDCSQFNVGCQVGECNALNGICGPALAPPGTSCSDGIPECYVGACDSDGACIPSSAANGSACNDHNSCTEADLCEVGACNGSPVAGCSQILVEGFEVCPNGWTFGGDWQCGTPQNVGPSSAHTGASAIATQIAGLYSVNQSYNTTVADSPPIDLTTAVNPVLSFWAWDHTEGGTFDGWNLKISTNGGQSFANVTSVSPAYNLTIAGQQAWGGDHSTEGWKLHTADLTAYIGQPVILRFSFRSDGATVFPGIYIDNVVVAEPQENPLFITTTSPLADVYAGAAYAVQMVKIGGTMGSEWNKVSGVNATWLNIDKMTGVLYGTPSAMQVGPVSVTIRVHEPTLPSNFDEKTFTFKVDPAAYYTSFEGMCPDGWMLEGDWECGVPTHPMMKGPAAAYLGMQCIGTQIDGDYNNLQTYALTTATSPDIDLTNVASPKVTFRMWIDTEGATYDGVNLQISTDGMNYTIVTNVLPVYPLTVAGKPAWGGHQSALDWQPMQADLTGYAGQIVRLRFAFQADASQVYPGVYIDDILVN